jgi:hypothetical protein
VISRSLCTRLWNGVHAMNLPVMRFTVRRMMLLVSVVAILMAGVVTFLTRPYPTGVIRQVRSGPGLRTGPSSPDEFLEYQLWSDGWAIRTDAKHPMQENVERFGPLMRVRWTDGAASWYWRGTGTPTRSFERVWDGSQTWHYTGGGIGGGAMQGPFLSEQPPRRP